MNRREFLKTCCTGLTAGIAAILGKPHALPQKPPLYRVDVDGAVSVMPEQEPTEALSDKVKQNRHLDIDAPVRLRTNLYREDMEMAMLQARLDPYPMLEICSGPDGTVHVRRVWCERAYKT